MCTCSVASRAQWKQARSINRAAKLFIRCCLRCKHCWLWCSPCNSITKAKTTNRSGKTVWRDVHCFRYIRLFVDISYGPGCIVFYFIVYISFAVSSKCDVCMCAALYCAVLFGCVWCCVFAVLIWIQCVHSVCKRCRLRCMQECMWVSRVPNLWQLSTRWHTTQAVKL